MQHMRKRVTRPLLNSLVFLLIYRVYEVVLSMALVLGKMQHHQAPLL